MHLSTGVESAAHCLVSLSQSARPLPAARLSELHGLATAYLAKQLQSLSRAGVVSAVAGQGGGYVLARRACEITLLDVVDGIDGSGPRFRCQEIRQRGPVAVSAARCSRPCAIAKAMADAEQAWRTVLGEISIADLARQINDASGGVALPGVRAWLADGDGAGLAHADA